MADDSAAQSAIATAVEEAGEQDSDRKVTVEVIHKQEGINLTLWGIITVLGIVFIFGGYLMMSDDSSGGPGGIFGGAGNCGDGWDNDSGGQADHDDPDCYSNPEIWEGYDPDRKESDGSNDPPGGQP